MGEPEVLLKFENQGYGTLTLNRPAKLNAMNLNMIRLLHQAVDEVDKRKGKLGVLITDGAGAKAYCAGGDVARVQVEAKAGGSLPNDFFFEEYGVVYRLATLFERLGCVQLAVWNGITMGGGVGVSAYGPIRLVTDTTVFAKPEMAIGFFPDVGSTRLLGNLTKASKEVGFFLGCTGTRLNAWDCINSGIATHYLPADKLPQFRSVLAAKMAGGASGEKALALCKEAIAEVAQGAEPSMKGAVLTPQNVEVINRCFDATTVEQIVANLKKEPGEFAKNTLETMYTSCSPTSCKVALKAIRNFAGKGAETSWGTVLHTEYRLAQRFSTRPQPQSDFFEGIRAVLLDKDRKQKWSPGWDELEKITDADVDYYFSPLETGHRRGELFLEHEQAWSEAERQTGGGLQKWHPMEIIKAPAEVLAKL